ncbi:hypothetical protein [Sphingomonas sp.]|uniref:hypothetical protein n=1 Tax=Sphingomonas sp. TaxID=28214 RepID=UPI003AFF9DCD
MSIARDPEQRARDGRLAWIIVCCCAVVSLVILGVVIHAVSTPLVRLAERSAEAGRPAPPTVSTDEPATSADEPATLALSAPQRGEETVRKRVGPPPSLRPAPPANRSGGASDEVRKGGSATEGQSGKSSRDDGAGSSGSIGRDSPGSDDDDGDEAPNPARRI